MSLGGKQVACAAAAVGGLYILRRATQSREAARLQHQLEAAVKSGSPEAAFRLAAEMSSELTFDERVYLFKYAASLGNVAAKARGQGNAQPNC